MTTNNDSPNLTLSITNQTDSPVIFVRVKDDSPSALKKDDPNLALDAYAQSLSLVSEVIPANGKGQVALDIANTGNYNLIGMSPHNLFPIINQVAAIPITGDQQSSSPSIEDLTVSQHEVEAMKQALLFHQSILAYPATEMAIAFIKILGNYKTEPLNVETSINQFFQQTENYQKCTLNSYVAVSTYCRYYAYAWANWQTNFTYEVFQPNPDSNGSEGLISVGKVIFTKKENAPNPADISDHNGGYDIIYQSNQGKIHPLSLINGHLCSTENNETPLVSLFFSYGIKSEFTNVETENFAWPILVGAADGLSVIAVGVPEASTPKTIQTQTLLQDSANTLQAWAKYFNPKTAEEWTLLIGKMVGFAIYIGLLIFAISKSIKYEQFEQNYKKAFDELCIREQKFLNEAKIIDQLPKTIDEDLDLFIRDKVDKIGIQQGETWALLAKKDFLKIYQDQFSNIKAIKEYSNSVLIKETIIKLNKIQTEFILKINNYKTYQEFYKTIMEEITEVNTNIKTLYESLKTSGDINFDLDDSILAKMVKSESNIKAIDRQSKKIDDYLEKGEEPIIEESYTEIIID